MIRLKPDGRRQKTARLAVALAAVTATVAVQVPLPPVSSEVARGRWHPTGAMNQPRQEHAAVGLLDGKVLVMGGSAGGTAALATAELYRHDKRTWKATGSMNTPRYRHTATLLDDGRVLVVGGRDANGPLASAEVYDPGSRTWSSAGSFSTGARYWHTATRLLSGDVLVAGGLTGKDVPGVGGELLALNTAEVWSPGTGQFRVVQPMLEARYQHSASPRRGRGGPGATVAGGLGMKSAERYFEGGTGFWESDGVMATTHRTQGMVSDGGTFASLVVGGTTTLSASAEKFTGVPPPVIQASSSGPSTQTHESPTWTPTAPMNSIRFWPAVVRLHGTPCFTTPAPTWCHKVLAAAGTDSVGPLASAELYDEATDVWTLTASLNQARSLHTGTLLANGKVLVAGGEGIDGTSLGSSEVFAPGAL